MTEQSTSKQEEPQEVIEAQDHEATSENDSAPKRGSALPWLLVIVLAAALAGAGWAGYRYVYQDLIATNQQLNEQVTAQEQKLTDLQRELDNKLAELERQQQQLPDLVKRQLQQSEQSLMRSVSEQEQRQSDLARAVQSVQAELASLDVSQATAWRILEARQLVAQASNKLYIDQAPELALQLLELADTHLAALNNPAYQAARQAINDDKVALRSVDADRHLAVAMELSSLRARLLQQDWRINAPTRTLVNEEPPADAPWYEHLQASASTLFQQLIRVQHREKPIEPQLSAAFVELAKQRVLLQLQLAQQAALSQTDELYQRSLQEALALVVELEQQSDLELAALRDDLTKLAAQTLQPDLPEQLRSLALINRHAQAVNAGVSQ
ncbi:uroporphyrinogen-III C-methyltransferase [Pseudidiomarina homiensis]|uniref:uroporphyrinogen-III C-methyltransferase n=1 Tax=Pseudidiomarina homiensis TaxID=364198 RepID=UPI00215A5E7E|nr:uroporphyrinogen-III C-methyltransferase [Pseudidiomarina homiensis]